MVRTCGLISLYRLFPSVPIFRVWHAEAAVGEVLVAHAALVEVLASVAEAEVVMAAAEGMAEARTSLEGAIVEASGEAGALVATHRIETVRKSLEGDQRENLE
jgi:hypothetical protein